ncbi:MAG: hypothetical protein PVG50_02495 [Thiohalophilus sp.]|jgi:intracellular sulfur oxidation DsrE/DsrF family protein
MNRDNRVSDEQLNALVDGQLDLDEQTRLLKILRDDPELSRKNCEFQKVHGLVKLTYESEQTPQYTSPVQRESRHRWLMGVAATLLVGFGVVMGWLVSNVNNNPSSLLELAHTVHVTPNSDEQQTWKVLLHVSSNDPYRFNILLNEAENLLKTSLKKHQSVEVEILTNGEGMELVHDSNRTYARRLKTLQQKYDNLVVSACNQSLKRLREQGINIQLLPQTRIVPSAINEALARQKKGWTYIRI